MPFADATYPPQNRRLDYGGWPSHIVRLTNGSRLFIREGRNLEIALCESDYDEPDYFVCSISCDGVLVYPNSGYACETLARRAADA